MREDGRCVYSSRGRRGDGAVVIIASGIMPGPSGVGRVLAGLIAERDRFSMDDVRFLTGGSGAGLGKAIRAHSMSAALSAGGSTMVGYTSLVRGLGLPELTDSNHDLVLIHPQSLSRAWIRAVARRRDAPITIYLMDNSFFCVRSYNHIPGEDSPCMRCLGGQFFRAREKGCRPYPPLSFGLAGLLNDLVAWVALGKIRFLAQTDAQATLLRQHFGDEVRVRVVGLWTSDFPAASEVPPAPTRGRGGFDVVFHGSADAAKGSLWALDVAERLPGHTFLFPMRSPGARGGTHPRNVTFRQMSWESGLDRAVRDAALVINPSLWSAPIEGALVKSILYGRRAAVVDIRSSWASELPDGLILRMPSQRASAAAGIADYLERPQPVGRQQKTDWYSRFAQSNELPLSRVMAATHD